MDLRSARNRTPAWTRWAGLLVIGGMALAGCGGGGIPVATPTPGPSASPTPGPTASPTPAPTASPTPGPTASPTPTPTPTAPPSLSCANNVDCPDDGLFCNGTAFCDQLTLSCVFNSNPPCDAATEECDEVSDTCIPITDPGCLSDADCNSVTEICNLDTGECVSNVTASCVQGSGACNIGNSSPGCENMACCEDICVVFGQVQCCLVAWDDACAQLALSQSRCLNP